MQYHVKPESFSEFLKLTNEKIHLRTNYSKLVGYWSTELGGLNEVVHIWEYGSPPPPPQVARASDPRRLVCTPLVCAQGPVGGPRVDRPVLRKGSQDAREAGLLCGLNGTSLTSRRRMPCCIPSRGRRSRPPMLLEVCRAVVTACVL